MSTTDRHNTTTARGENVSIEYTPIHIPSIEFPDSRDARKLTRIIEALPDAKWSVRTTSWDMITGEIEVTGHDEITVITRTTLNIADVSKIFYL